MGAYDFAITHFNGTAFSGHADIESVSFDPSKWPARTARQKQRYLNGRDH